MIIVFGQFIVQIDGLGDPDTPFVTIAQWCGHCGADLGRRTYDVRDFPHPEEVEALITPGALKDGLRAAAHRCGERN